jgi:hypothetical protein
MKNNGIKPVGLKGNDILNRMKDLMGMSPINENKSNSVVELSKVGPDGKVYGIVRENHEYYIKTANNATNLMLEDFNYIGGLQNKKSEAYPSYAKAIKQLNLKFLSLNEAYGKSGQINVFENDNLITEHHGMKPEAALSATKGVGDNQEYVVNKKGKDLSYDNKEGKAEYGFGDNLVDGKAVEDFEDAKLNENELAIDSMIIGEEEVTSKKGFSISRAVEEMDSIIESVPSNSKVSNLLEGLTVDEMIELSKALKKKL